MAVLACPHCDRMFHATPRVLGKAIRCRGCRKPFRVPLDPSKADLGPKSAAPQPEIRIAVECHVDGRDARRCPDCGRAFAMNPGYTGKRIRCRGCRVHFVVLASTRLAEGAEPVEAGMGPTSVEAPTTELAIAEESEQEIAEESSTPIHEDYGDVAAEDAGEALAAAVRPRAFWRTRLTYEPFRGPFRSGRF
jgi:hypothetical protein